MMPSPLAMEKVNQRVRAILLTERGTVLFIKRIKPEKPEAYWVAPGGGVEDQDDNLDATLSRELSEELGAEIKVLYPAFVLKHHIGGQDREEHFFVCRLLSYDLSKRNGPEFADPTRGQYIPVEIPLDEAALRSIYIKTEELRDWLIDNLDALRRI